MVARFAAGLIILVLLVVHWIPQIYAAEYFVNARGGSDDNTGLASNRAFKTITYALETIRTENATPATINIAAGEYSADSNGEVYPLDMTSATSLLGAGPPSTFLICDERETDVIVCCNIADVVIEGMEIIQNSTGGQDRGICICESRGHFLVRFCNIQGFWNSIWTYGECIDFGDKDKEIARKAASSITLSIEDCYMRDGGVFCGGSSDSWIKRSTFVDDRVGDGGRLTIEDCLFVDSGIGLGGGEVSSSELQRTIVSFGHGDNLIEKCKFIGGGIYGDAFYSRPGQRGDTVIRDCLIANKPKGSGIMWEVRSWNADMPTRASIQLAPADTPVRPAVDEFWLEIENTVITGNQGGVFVFWQLYASRPPPLCHLRMSDCRVIGNPNDGVHVRDARGEGDVEIENSFVSGNCENSELYGAIHSYGCGSTTVENCTVADNSLAGLRSWYAESTTIRNSVFWGNEPYEIIYTEGAMSVTNTCVEGGYEGEGDIDLDPLFTSGPMGTHYLSSIAAGQNASSPCLDAGSTSASIAGLNYLTTTTDNAFDTGLADMGYHYPATPPTIECRIAGSEIRADEALVFGPGDTLSAQVTVANDGMPIWVDVYAGFIVADGTIFCITPSGLTSEFTPYATDILLDAPLHFGPAPVFEFILNEHVIPGTYTFAATLSRAREPFHPIGSISTTDFTIDAASDLASPPNSMGPETYEFTVQGAMDGKGGGFPPKKKAEEIKEEL